MPEPKPPRRFAGAPFSKVPLRPDRSVYDPARLLVSVPFAMRVGCAVADWEVKAAADMAASVIASEVFFTGDPF